MPRCASWARKESCAPGAIEARCHLDDSQSGQCAACRLRARIRMREVLGRLRMRGHALCYAAYAACAGSLAWGASGCVRSYIPINERTEHTVPVDVAVGR